MSSTIIVKPEAYSKILGFLRQKKKIKAIKIVRDESGSDLKASKQAIDRLAIERDDIDYQGAVDPHWPRISCGPKILDVTLDYGSGPVKVSLENMQMTILSELHTIGLDAVADVLDVIEVLKALDEGRRIIVTDEKVV